MRIEDAAICGGITLALIVGVGALLVLAVWLLIKAWLFFEDQAPRAAEITGNIAIGAGKGFVWLYYIGGACLILFGIGIGILELYQNICHVIHG